MNRNLAGGDLTSFITKNKNVAECATKCAKHAECDAFTFHKRSGRCWIKRAGHNQLTYDGNLISGFKSCYTGTCDLVLAFLFRRQ